LPGHSRREHEWRFCRVAVLYGFENRHGGDRLADRSGLKQRLGIDGCTRFHICYAVPFCPVNFEVFDNGNTDSRNSEPVHHLIKRKRIKSLSVRMLWTFNNPD